MRLLRSSNRPQAVECFFCLSPSVLPPQQASSGWKGKGKVVEVGSRLNWRCERCGCWNVKDEHGEMVSDLPAMHNSSLNIGSFALRATPSNSHLPSTSSSTTSPFCRSCLANQTLIMNMLANYLPEDNDPAYTKLYTGLHPYLANLHARYPPVCPACQPAVDSALRKSDHRAQNEALGFALRRGASKTASRSAYGEPGLLAVLVWRVRGLLFCCGTAQGWMQGILAWVNPELEQHLLETTIHGVAFPTILLAFNSLSIFWIAWDPYWLRRIRHKAKIKGRRTWVQSMLSLMWIRILASIGVMYLSLSATGAISPSHILIIAFVAEVVLLPYALLYLRISHPVPIQLVRPVSSTSTPLKGSSPTAPNYDDHPSSSPTGLSSLSLEHNPLQHSNPIFGQPSLQQYTVPETHPDQAEPMDWEPSPAAAVSNGGWTSRPTPRWSEEYRNTVLRPIKSDWDGFAVGKQRMFPYEPGKDETGLESLLAGWGIGGTSGLGNDGSATNGAPDTRGLVVDVNLAKFLMLCMAATRILGAVSLLSSPGLTNRVVSIDNAQILFITLEMAIHALFSVFLMLSWQSLSINIHQLCWIIGTLALRVLLSSRASSWFAQWSVKVWSGPSMWIAWGVLDVACCLG